MFNECEVATRDVRFRYVTGGNGPTVVLVPGSGGWLLTFERLARRLAASYTVLAVDPPGQGATRVTNPGFGYTADAVAGSLADFHDTVGLERAAVVGHSWGGGFALRLAELRPDLVERLALLAPAGIAARDVWEFRLLRRPVIGELAARLTSAASVRHMLRKSFAHAERMPTTTLITAAAWQLTKAPDAARLRRDMLRIERGVEWTVTEQNLTAIGCPVLILWGDHDRYLSVQLLHRFTSVMPNAVTHVVPGAGHSLHDDVATQVDPLLIDFLGARGTDEEPSSSEGH